MPVQKIRVFLTLGPGLTNCLFCHLHFAQLFFLTLSSLFYVGLALRNQFMETQAFHDLMQDSTMYDSSHSTTSSDAGSPFPSSVCPMSSATNSESEIEVATSTTPSLEEEEEGEEEEEEEEDEDDGGKAVFFYSNSCNGYVL
jgi:hypothetical protein